MRSNPNPTDLTIFSGLLIITTYMPLLLYKDYRIKCEKSKSNINSQHVHPYPIWATHRQVPLLTGFYILQSRPPSSSYSTMTLCHKVFNLCTKVCTYFSVEKKMYSIYPIKYAFYKSNVTHMSKKFPLQSIYKTCPPPLFHLQNSLFFFQSTPSISSNDFHISFPSLVYPPFPYHLPLLPSPNIISTQSSCSSNLQGCLITPIHCSTQPKDPSYPH